MMKKILRPLSYILILAVVLGMTGCAKETGVSATPLPEQEKLVVYTSHKPEIYEPIIKEFEDRSGIWVEVIQGGTNEILDTISEKSGDINADIMFGGGVDSLEVYVDLFAPYITSQADNLNKTYSSATDSYTVFSELPIVFIYNTKLVIPAGTPRTWRELLTSQWKGKIAFANPNQSGSAYTALATMIQALASEYDEAEIVAAFVENLNGDICAGSGDVINDVMSGKKAIGITLEETALKQIDKGAEIGIVYPQDGTSMVPDGCAILKNAPHKDNAELFMEFIVGDDVQRLLEERLFRRTVRSDFDKSSSIQELNYDIHYAIASRSDILTLWDMEAGE